MNHRDYKPSLDDRKFEDPNIVGMKSYYRDDELDGIIVTLNDGDKILLKGRMTVRLLND